MPKIVKWRALRMSNRGAQSPIKPKMWLVLVLVVVAGSIYGGYKIATFDPYVVIKVRDGGRFDIQSQEGIRLIGVVCQPIADNDVGKRAQEFSAKRILGRSVTVEVGEDRGSMAGWTNAYVFIEYEGKTIFLNEELLREGLGTLNIVAPNTKYSKRLRAADAEARENKKGMWHPDYKRPL